MGIGRLEFLRLTSLALAGLGVNPLQSVVTNEDLYLNKKLGLLFYKPKGWGFLSVKDFGKLKDAQIIGTELDVSKEEIWEELGDPICIATKHFLEKPENKGIFSPTITVHVTPKEEFEGFEFDSFEEIIEISEHGTSLLLKDFKVVKRYEPSYISNCKFYEYDAEYLFEHVDLSEPLPAELKVFKAENNQFYYDFNCHQSKTQNQIAGKEFEEFKNSIKLI